MREAVIVDCLRTAVGKSGRGALRNTRPDDLAAAVIGALVERYPAVKDDVDDVILGCAIPEGEAGSNMARQALLRAGLSDAIPGMTINRFCSSGLQAIAWRRSPYARAAPTSSSRRLGIHVADAPRRYQARTLIRGFVDNWPEVYLSMGLTAERMHRKYGVSREDADASRCLATAMRCARRPTDTFGTKSCRSRGVCRAGQSWSIASSIATKGRVPTTSLEALAKLKPAFKVHGTVTAGNSSQTSDGAAAAIVMSEAKARQLGLRPKARFVSFAVAGVPPEIMGIGPVAAIPKALALAGLKLHDIGLIELNEAFAVQALGVIRRAGLDPERINVNGGAIALGHPLGCTGAKLTATILREMERRSERYGMVTMCVGGGQGAAGIFELLQ
jgi:acetyl-CoA acyltransferase